MIRPNLTDGALAVSSATISCNRVPPAVTRMPSRTTARNSDQKADPDQIFTVVFGGVKTKVKIVVPSWQPNFSPRVGGCQSFALRHDGAKRKDRQAEGHSSAGCDQEAGHERPPQGEYRTPCRTHIFLSVAPYDHHTHLLLAQEPGGSSLGCVPPLRILKAIHSQHVSSTTH